ncbi:MAG: hypothetical protein Q8830_03475, partial [Candidatus Phytoplasma australasiaticum]|nr:hypothetical protein [Candidatus Phytoplasma australasiaticum]
MSEGLVLVHLGEGAALSPTSEGLVLRHLSDGAIFLNNHKLKHKIAKGKRQLNGVVLTLGKK